MINLVENDRVSPLCPHCEKQVTTLNCQKIKSGLGVRFLYFCGQCHKTLGISHRKGFWMG